MTQQPASVMGDTLHAPLVEAKRRALLRRRLLQTSSLDASALKALLRERGATTVQDLETALLERGLVGRPELQQVTDWVDRQLLVCHRCRTPHEIDVANPDVVGDCPSCNQPLERLHGGDPEPGESTRKVEYPATLDQAAMGQATTLRPPVGEPAPPQRVGAFDLLEQIGEGGMGVVYRAFHQAMRREVALKMLKSGSRASRTQVIRFMREVRAAAKLRHPNIVAVHHIGTEDGHYFTMDYIRGRTLKQVIESGEVTQHRACELAGKLAAAMQYAHENGVVHRDVNPRNILIDDETGEPLLMDFGVAKQINEDLDMTRSGMPIGTPQYMAPEQAMGDLEKVGTQSDIYGLGAVLYEMLTGQVPFPTHPNESLLNLLRRVSNDDPRPPCKVNPRIHRDAETITLKAISKDPQRRYATAKAMGDDLTRHLHDEPIVARPYSIWERWWRRIRRNKTLTGLVLTILVGLMSFVGYLVQVKVERGRHLEELYRSASSLEPSRRIDQQERSLRLYERILEMDPENFRALDRHTKVQVRIAKMKAAQEAHRRRVLQERQDQFKARLKTHLDKAAQLEKQGTVISLREAHEEYTKILVLSERQFDAEVGRTRVRRRIEAIERAAREKVARQRQARLDELFARGRELEAQPVVEQLEQALLQYERVLEIDRTNFEALRRKTAVTARIEELTRAARLARANERAAAADRQRAEATTAWTGAVQRLAAARKAIRAGQRAEARKLLAARRVLLVQVQDGLGEAQTQFTRSLEIAEQPAVRRRLTRAYLDSFLAAEALDERGLAQHYARLVRSHDTEGALVAQLVPRGTLRLTLPVASKIQLSRIEPVSARTLTPLGKPVAGTSLVREGLEAGNYLIAVQPDDAALRPIRIPIRLSRDQTLSFEPKVPRREPATDALEFIPAGSFELGGDTRALQSLPVEEVYLRSYWIARHEVTFAAYCEYLATLKGQAWEDAVPKQGPTRLFGWLNGRLVPQSPQIQMNMPAVCVSLVQARGYVAWLAARTGLPYRLPDELEWEKAARGSDGRIYPWGNDYEPGLAVVGRPGQPPRLEPGGHAPGDISIYGVRDMAGSVAEWTTSKHMTLSVVRGGSYMTLHNMARAAKRNYFGDQRQFTHIGFRLVLDLAKE